MSLENEEKETLADFKKAVNMTAKQIEKWLESDESKAVGFKEDDESESVGHQSGKHIIEILSKKQADYTADDFKFMKKVNGYVHRHLAQRPSGDISETNWRYSLMNWGHDPRK